MPRKKTGAVRSKKKTIDGIIFASTLESYCYTSLKSNGLEFKYEGESITLIPSFAPVDGYYKSVLKNKNLVHAGSRRLLPITYKPDFISHKHKFYIETKGFVPSQHTFTLRWKLFLRWLNDNNMSDYKVFLVKNQSQVDEAIKIITNG
jgi:hypothetical protein